VPGQRLELIWGLAFSCGAASQLLARLSGLPAVVFSAIILSTGPTVISPLVRQMQLEALRSQLLEAEGLILEPLAAVASLFALRLDRSNRVDFFGDTGGDGLPLAVQPTLPECDQTIPVKFQTAN
jgi:NhaP-type Na+/H+ or K+/H+ antiporter